MQHWKYLLLCAGLGAASLDAAACYTVYDRSERVVYQSSVPPVDMSRPIHETLPLRYPGGHLIFDTSADCQAIGPVATRRGGRDTGTSSPLLTDERTAAAMKLPHTTLAGGIALVQARDANMAPGLTFVPAAVPVTALAAANPPNTAMMGAGPRRGPVITELRDPPIVIEQANGRVTVQGAPR
jgi:hypothetical protein